MRAFEVLLLFVNLIVFMSSVFPLLKGTAFLRHSAHLAVLVALIHVSLEGQRWQMVPAYALTALFFLVWIIKNMVLSETRVVKSRTNWAAFSLGIVFIAVSMALPVVVPVPRIPKPSGPYMIGTLIYHWMDANRPELFSDDPDDRRELMMQLWYPARRGASTPQAHYVQDARSLAPLARLLHLPGFALCHLEYVATNAFYSAPVAYGEARYPVLIFSHGRCGFRQHNTWQIEELVSHGYVVAAIDHTYAASGVTFPGGRTVSFDPRMLDRAFIDCMIPYLARDAVFALDQLATLDRADPRGILTGRLDTDRAGIFGVSMGGEISTMACLIEPRFRACLVMDVWMPNEVVKAGLKLPAMFISRDSGTMKLEGWSNADIAETLNTMRAVFEGLPGDGYFVLVPGMFHQDFSDAPLLSPITSLMGITGPIGGRRAHEITSAYSLAFFDRHLKGRPEALLAGPSAKYPEIILERR